MRNQIEIHPNTLYATVQLEDLGYDVETICEIAEVDQDVFDSHQTYTSALYVAQDIANDINKQIHKEFFNGENSEIDDERYELTSEGDYTLKYKFTAQFTKFSGEDILTQFGINGEGFFETEEESDWIIAEGADEDNDDNLNDYDLAVDLYENDEYEMLIAIFGESEAYRMING